MLRCRLLSILFVVFLVSSCVSTDVSGVWKDVNYSLPVKKIMLIGLGDNPARRGVLENTLSAFFIREGKQAVPSVNFFENISSINKKNILSISSENRINTVMIARIVLIDQEKHISPDAYPEYYNSFFKYFDKVGRVGKNYYNSEFALKETLVSLEINLYEMTHSRLVWAITTETFFSENINQELNKVAKIIISKLEEEALL